jgi:protein Mpv17
MQYVLPGDPTSPVAVLAKVALDQTVMAPVMTAAFFAAMALLDSSAAADAPNALPGRVARALVPTLRANWLLWPAAHAINFALVPPSQRILYITCVNVSKGAIHVTEGAIRVTERGYTCY